MWPHIKVTQCLVFLLHCAVYGHLQLWGVAILHKRFPVKVLVNQTKILKPNFWLATNTASSQSEAMKYHFIGGGLIFNMLVHFINIPSCKDTSFCLWVVQWCVGHNSLASVYMVTMRNSDIESVKMLIMILTASIISYCVIQWPVMGRDHFVYTPSQWETTLQCNVVSHWLGAFTEWSLYGVGDLELRESMG